MPYKPLNKGSDRIIFEKNLRIYERLTNIAKRDCFRLALLA